MATRTAPKTAGRKTTGNGRRRTVPQPSAPAQNPADYRPDPQAPVGTPDWLIGRAFQLERERTAVQEKVAANRRSLRDLDAQDALTDVQSRWLDIYYPEKERGEQRSKDQIEATRKARENARKDGKQS